MIRYIFRRVVFLIFVLVCSVFLVFVTARVVPADPARMAMGQTASEEAVEKYRRANGLDKPLATQFVIYLRNLVGGDLGRSILTTRPVREELLSGIPATVELVIPALILGTTIGIGLGVISAVSSGKYADHIARVGSLFGMSMPVFWLGLVTQIVFYRWLGILPIGQRLSFGLTPPPMVTGLYTVDSLLLGDFAIFLDALKHLLLPVSVLSLSTLAIVARMTRSVMMELLSADYIRTAYGKGLARPYVLLRHAFPNALVPIVTIVGLKSRCDAKRIGNRRDNICMARYWTPRFPIIVSI